MAANGHGGLPPAIHAPSAIGGAMMAPTPNPGTPPNMGGGSDREIVQHAVQMLHQALGQIHDTEYKAHFAQALATFTKALAADQKEQHQAMAGKLSPRVMARAYGN